MDFILTALLGVAIGALVKLLIPGERRTDLALAMLLSAAGALAARFLGQILDWFQADEPIGYLSAVVGSVTVLVIYGVLFRRGNHSPH